jgi:hypothetical protein
VLRGRRTAGAVPDYRAAREKKAPPSLTSGRKRLSAFRERHWNVSRSTAPPVATVLRAAGVVDCWIGIEQEGDRRVVRLAGKLGAAQVPDLLLACTRSGLLHVDLTELVSIDAAGVEALRRVRARGAILSGASGYIQLKLDSPADSIR